MESKTNLTIQNPGQGKKEYFYQEGSYIGADEFSRLSPFSSRPSVSAYPDQRAITFETIDLVTVMQIINMEKKTSAIEIDIRGRTGMIYFIDGEIIHSEFDGLEGEASVSRLIHLSTGAIKVKALQARIERTIHTPFPRYIMNIMKSIDENRRDRTQAGEEYIAEVVDPAQPRPINPEVHHSIGETLKTLTQVKGYLGAVVLDAEGRELARGENNETVPVELSAPLIQYAVNVSRQMCREGGFGELEMLQFTTKKAIIFSLCQNDGDRNLTTILVTRPDANVKMATLKLKQAAEALRS
ncbi:MAG: DUF4388 domain-containing protein [bacterium]|nr:DUF4388 domain-containing protein [bacterium]